jgi:hypothetical protein
VFGLNYTIPSDSEDGPWTASFSASDLSGNTAEESASIFVIRNHSIQFRLSIPETESMVDMGSDSQLPASGRSNSTVAAPRSDYITSSIGGILRALVSVGANFKYLGFGSSSGTHEISVTQELGGSGCLLAFTKGDSSAVERRMAEIESGSFFSYPEPTFGFGLGTKSKIKILIGYPDIDIEGSMDLRHGNQGITVSQDGVGPDGRQRILISQYAS